MKTGWALVVLMAAAPLAHAQYKCVAPNGKTSYQEQPCAPGAKAGEMGTPKRPAPRPYLAAPDAPSGPDASGLPISRAPEVMTMVYYDLAGAEMSALHSGI